MGKYCDTIYTFPTKYKVGNKGTCVATDLKVCALRKNGGVDPNDGGEGEGRGGRDEDPIKNRMTICLIACLERWTKSQRDVANVELAT